MLTKITSGCRTGEDLANNVGKVLLLICILFSLTAPKLAISAGIIIKPLLIRHGIESQISLKWPLKDTNQIFKSEYYKEPLQLAQKAGIDLRDSLDQPGVASYSSENKNFFQLFYNTAIAPSCQKNYLIQRVKITRSYYDDYDRLYRQNHSYLVEVMKTKQKTLKRADRHIRSYSVNEAARRNTLIEAEIGCGNIPKVAEGSKWPYKKDSLYEKIQDYKSSPGLYDKVEFEFSQKYSFGFEFSETGLKSVKWPYFIK